MLRTLLACTLLTSCSEYDFDTDKFAGPPPFDTAGTPEPGDDPDPDGPTEPTGSTDPTTPELEPPPGYLDGDCLEGMVAEVMDDEIYVLSWDPVSAATGIVATEAGWYHIYNIHIVESGDSQRNESAAFRVRSVSYPDGLPLWGNCGAYWVVADADNDGPPPGTRTYIGTFWLDVGTNDLEMAHYCPLYRDGWCESFHDEQPDSTCDSGNVNSVHFTGYGLCIIPAE